MSFNRDIGHRISVVRREHNLTQSELGQRLDPPCSHVAISDIERGKTRIDFERLSQIAHGLGVSMRDLTPSGTPMPAQPEQPLMVFGDVALDLSKVRMVRFGVGRALVYFDGMEGPDDINNASAEALRAYINGE